MPKVGGEGDGKRQGSSKLPSANCHDWIIALGWSAQRRVNSQRS